MECPSLRFPSATLLSLFFFGGSVAAEDCSFLRRDPLDLRDRQVFFQIKGDTAWAPLDGTSADLANQNVTYAYVIRETIDPARNGILVVKSARVRQLDESRRPTKNDMLVRHVDGSDNKSCGVISEFGEQSVPAKSYDDFHDLGLAVPEIKTIRSFHIKYAARLNHCRRTDDNGPDSVVPRDPRSNRGQFSFNPDVVSRETYSQVLALAGATTAYASSENLDDQRVEIKQYQVSANFPTCVRFTPPAQGRSSFLKINDLEALTQVSPGSGYVRADEKGWALSR
jgi:hypothetical protein